MPMYRINYDAHIRYYMCTTIIKADSEEEAITLLESNYSNYENDSEITDFEIEIEDVMDMGQC